MWLFRELSGRAPGTQPTTPITTSNDWTRRKNFPYSSFTCFALQFWATHTARLYFTLLGFPSISDFSKWNILLMSHNHFIIFPLISLIMIFLLSLLSPLPLISEQERWISVLNRTCKHLKPSSYTYSSNCWVCQPIKVQCFWDSPVLWSLWVQTLFKLHLT